jgi:RimJ/RimL family protein N-acetyltransferase
MASIDDVGLLFNWANDPSVRSNSYSNQPIDYDTHVEWFTRRIDSENFLFYIFLNEEKLPIGLVRFEKSSKNKEAIISISIDERHRGNGYSVEMLKQASLDFLQKNDQFKILAYIFKTNEASFNSFKKAGYKFLTETCVNNVPSYILYESK